MSQVRKSTQPTLLDVRKSRKTSSVVSTTLSLSWTSSKTILLLLVSMAILSVVYLGYSTHFFDSQHNDRRPKTSQQYAVTEDASVVVSPAETKTVTTSLVAKTSLRRVEPVSFVEKESSPEEAVQHVTSDNRAVPETAVVRQGEEGVQPAAASVVGAADSNPKPNIPGSEKHPILAMSDEELKSTPVSALMQPYGEAEGGGTCAMDFGNQLVNRWRETKDNYCLPNAALSSKALNSKVDCYLVQQTRHHGNGDQICVLQNVAVDLKLFADGSFTKQIIEKYVETRHMKQPYPSFPRGFIQGDCKPREDVWKAEFMPGWNADLTVQTFQALSGAESEKAAEECTEWIDHPVIFQQRDTFANFFHDSEDFVNVFLTMAVLQWKPEETQLMLTDLYPEGPFWEMWSKVFSHGHPAMTAFDLKEKYGSSPGKVCFRKLAIGIYGPAAPTTIASWDTPCTHTALVRAYSDFVIRSLNLQAYTHYAQPQPTKTVTVTFMSRRPSKEWPEKKYCDNDHSFFLCKYWENFGPRSLGRMIRNDGEVAEALKKLETETFKNSKVQVKVQTVDFNVLTFEEQIKVDLETDIMVGPHGAGLMHNIFMRDRAHLIELFIDGSAANRHFHNLAHWYGRSYTGDGTSNPVNTMMLTQTIRNAINAMDLESY